jgi:glycosyltransferase involved in cell wall biosynthesis
MRIAHVITGLDTGGAEMMLKKVISETASGPFEHVVISLKGVGAVGRSLERLGIPVIALGGTSGRFSLSLLIRLARQLRDTQPDVVQAWMYHANFAAWGAKALSRAKWPLYWSVRCSIGDSNSIKWTTRLTRNVCALLSKPVTRIIYNSHLARRQHEAIGYPKDKGVVIPNGFDTAVFRPSESSREAVRRRYGIADNQAIVGHVARAQPMKDQPTLLSAALKVFNKAPQTMFILAGPGMPGLAEARPESRAAINALGDQLILLPEQKNVQELMAAFDIFVLSSAFGEGFPNVLGEALSCGSPCVATDVGDCAIVVGDGGIIVPPRDADRMASAIQALLDMPESARREIGLAARSRMQKDYSLANVAGLYSTCWREPSENFEPRGTLCAE